MYTIRIDFAGYLPPDATTGLSVEIISQNIGDKTSTYGVGVHLFNL